MENIKIDKKDLDYNRIYNNQFDALNKNIDNTVSNVNQDWWADNDASLEIELRDDNKTGLVYETQSDGSKIPMGYVNIDNIDKDLLNNKNNDGNNVIGSGKDKDGKQYLMHANGEREYLSDNFSAGDSFKTGGDGGIKSSDFTDAKSDYLSSTYDVKNIDSSSIIRDTDGTIKGYTTKDGSRVIVDPNDQKAFTNYYNSLKNDFKNSSIISVQKVLGSATLDNHYKNILSKKKNLENSDNYNNNVGQDNTKNVLESTGATLATLGTSLVEGIGDFGENIIKAGALATSIVVSPIAALDDLIKGNTGEETSLSSLWSGTRATVENNFVQSAFDDFYDNNSAGKWMKNNSFGYDITRGVSSGIGKVAGVVGSALLTGGGSLAVEPLAVIMGTSEFASGTGKSWKNGASTGGGLAAGAVNGVVSGGLTYVGGNIASSSALSPVQKIVANSSGGALKGFADPLTTSIGNSNTNYVNEFNKLGGMKNVGVNAAVAGGATAIGEGITAARSSFQPYGEYIGIEGGAAGNTSAGDVVYGNGPVGSTEIKPIDIARETSSAPSGAIGSRNLMGIEGGIDSNPNASNIINASGPTVPYQQVAKPSIVDADVIDGRALDSATVTTNMGNDLNVNELGQKIIDTTRNALEN